MVAINHIWRSPPECLVLAYGEVHLWCVDLRLYSAQVQNLKHILAPNEQARAERFYFQRDREHFIAARALLRNILGRYLDTPSSDVYFCYNQQGKPFLAGQVGLNGLCFNLSHSGGLALYAVTRGRAIGVDIELIRPGIEYDGLARRFFSPGEVAALCGLPSSMRLAAFFAAWTRKEAYSKAKGKGLSLPLDQFDVSLTPGEPAALLNTRWDPGEAGQWSLHEIIPRPGYVAAVAVEGVLGQLDCWHWPAEPPNET